MAEEVHTHTHVESPHQGVAVALHLSPPCGAGQHCLLRKSEGTREGGKERGRGGGEEGSERRRDGRRGGGRERKRKRENVNEREDESKIKKLENRKREGQKLRAFHSILFCSTYECVCLVVIIPPIRSD
jgi:hypothetical protein